MEQNKELKHPLTPRSHFYEIQKEDLIQRYPQYKDNDLKKVSLQEYHNLDQDKKWDLDKYYVQQRHLYLKQKKQPDESNENSQKSSKPQDQFQS